MNTPDPFMTAVLEDLKRAKQPAAGECYELFFRTGLSIAAIARALETSEGDVEKAIRKHGRRVVARLCDASRTGTKRNLDALRAAGWRLMLSPAGELRTEGFPNYALDNGAWSAYTSGKPFSFDNFFAALRRFGPGADFVVVPDVVMGGIESLDLSLSWLPRVLEHTQVAMIAVQNGMTANHLSGILGPRVGVFVGGNDEWKEATCGAWSTAAHLAGGACHVGRVNTLRRLRIVSMGGADSFDGSGASKWLKHLNRMERWLRQPTFRFREMTHAFSA